MKTCVALAGALSALACSEAPSQPSGSSTRSEPISEMPGYVHVLGKSRFALGQVSSQKSEFGVDKVIGEWGVFATHQTTRMVMGLPNSGAPPTLRPPLTGDAETHNAAVRAYLVGAGLQDDQIDSVSVNTSMSARGTGTEPPDAWQLESYSSVIHRKFGSIPVVDSLATATMNDLGESVNETVYWPEIPRSVLEDATRFRAMLEDPKESAAFYAKLPAGAHGKLVIRHTPGTWAQAFQAVAAYDVDMSFGMTKHHDEGGNEITLANE